MEKTFNIYLNTLRQLGNLVYEYNPFHNYQTEKTLYLVDDTFLVPEKCVVNTKNGEILNLKSEHEWVDKRGKVVKETLDPESQENPKPYIFEEDYYKKAESGVIYAQAGSLIDLDTELLNFDLEHPVDIEVQPSYDGSVNLILNDDKNIPRLINSRFSVREKDTYEIVDRVGENDTNIYNSKTFDKDTSLYFQYESNPIINYLGFVKGRLPVGLYCFYFTYCDSDNNESDFVAESGLIPVFIGDDKDPKSMDGGIKNQLSDKGIQLKLSNIDKAYNYLKVYYVRYFADYLQNRVLECKKIYLKFPINSNNVYLQITGLEEAEDIDANILNISKFNPKSILTQALCKNMLFFGNIVKNTDNYKELTDLALRIIPQLSVSKNFDSLDNDYISEDGAYYNSLNIYNKTGYFNQEYYRFGVVFIYQNGMLSNVYNTLGGILDLNGIALTGDLYSSTNNEYLLKRNYIKTDDNGWIKSDDSYTISGSYLNSKGVCKLNYTCEYDDKTVFSIKFSIPFNVIKMLREDLGIRGLFFVRLKCIPTIIALCYLLKMDDVLHAPMLEEGTGQNKKYYTECFVSYDGRVLKLDIDFRLHTYQTNTSTNAFAGICPDFLLNQPYFNQIFNGSKFRLQKISSDSHLKRNGRFFNESDLVKYNYSSAFNKVTICSVTENVPTVAIEDKTFKLNIGQAEESYKFGFAEVDNGSYNVGDGSYEQANWAVNIVRGIYSPYLAIYSNSGELETGCLYNIYLDSSISEDLEFLNRMNSSEPFYSISNRYNLEIKDSEFECWRGDCYINQFTHRLNRNFNDPSLPNNDVIVDYNTWRDNYNVEDPEDWLNISRSDINAVQLGSWITFKVRSSSNYALRSLDHSYVSEEALMGTPRNFYPRSYLLWRGENKIPESYLYNDAYRASLGFKCYYTLLDINYLKNTFSNRIQYSAIAIQDSFKNNYRESMSTYFRDYSQEYGSIQKLVGFEGYILVIFEHGIGLAVINERVLASQGEGEPVFINTKNVLPEELTIISDTYGTQWGDSVIKTEAGYVYGIDTITKKIWRVKGQLLEILSDFKVNKFLIDNISLSSRELYPTIGLRNVKTHYNNNKKDVIFTFYDDVYKDEEKVWSLCYNELLGLFITFYSWVPSYSANIDTKFFTFDRDTAKSLALLSKCNYSIPENSGVLVDSPVILNFNNLPKLYYTSINKSKVINYTIINEDGTTSLKTITKDCTEDNGHYILENVKFRIEKDHWLNYDYFEINDNQLVLNNSKSQSDLIELFNRLKVVLLYITPYLSNISSIIADSTAQTQFLTECIAITLSSIVTDKLTTDFYLHGLAGIFNVAENLYPTYWYGKYHPFEFEFIVNDKIALLKIFENLVIISNKAEPESFHFEIEGDNYEFSSDKRTMYFRLEATKLLYLNLGSDILFNRKYTDVTADKYTYELYYRTEQEPLTLEGEDLKSYDYKKIDRVYPVNSHGLVQQKKSTIFPLYYERIDTYNDIYHKYLLMKGDMYDFLNLSGSEISWNRDLNQFNIITHIKNSPIDLVGRLRGNSRYKEGKWNIQIPSITFMLKNEQPWEQDSSNPFIVCNSLICGDETLEPKQYKKYFLPPIIINSLYVPRDLDSSLVSQDKLPNIYTLNNYNPGIVDTRGGWTSRKESKIRDKWMKVRVRYSGKNLAIIHSIATLYNISYS